MAAKQRAIPKKAARGFGPIHDRMKGPTLPKSTHGHNQAENLPNGFRDGKPKTESQDTSKPLKLRRK